MTQEQRHPAMVLFSKYDPELADLRDAVRALVDKPRALDDKTMSMITVAIDATSNRELPTRSVAAGARNRGVTRQQIYEILRFVFCHRDPFFLLLEKLGIAENEKMPSIDEKTRVLIEFAVDCFQGDAQAVKETGDKARAIGITDEELCDVVRNIFLREGLTGLSPALAAFGRFHPPAPEYPA